jgi:hypothetical protein
MKSDLILKEVESILEKNKSNTLPLTEYKEKLTKEHKDLSEAYPGIFDMSMNNTMDLERLKFMLSMWDKVDNSEMTEHDASVEVGQRLVDDFVKPSLNK